MTKIDGVYWYELNMFDKIEFRDLEDTKEGYNNCLDLIWSQPRWVLDNLEYIKEFSVPWLHYGSREYCKKTGRNYAISLPYQPKKKLFIKESSPKR